jgi:hypothetical protein
MRSKIKYKRDVPAEITQLIDFANLLPPDAPLPDPRGIEPEKRDADLLRELTESFELRFRPRLPLTRPWSNREKARLRKELERRGDWKFSKHELSLGERISYYAEREYRNSRSWSWFSTFFVYSGRSDASLDLAPIQIYQLFWLVRATFASLAEAGIELEGQKIERPIEWELPPIFPKMSIGPDRTIRISESFDRFFTLCVRPLEGLDLNRIKRCPACHVFFFAKPSHKGACDLHLGLVRQWRARGKQAQYEESRQINSLVREKRISIGKAKAEAKAARSKQEKVR